MTDDNKEASPPQPIVIQSGALLPVEESVPVQTDDSASARQVKGTSDELGRAIERYETLNAQSDPGGALSVIALIFLFGGPFLAISSMDSFMDLEEAFNVCCGGILIGIVLVLIASSQSNAYQKEVRQAFDAVKSEANVQTPPTTQTNVLVAVVLMLFGFMMFSFDPNLFLLGIIMIAAGVVTASVGNTNNNKKFRQQVLEQAKLELARHKGK